MTDEFDQWFASYLDQEVSQVAELLKNKTANRFLIVWSIFESNCFEGFVEPIKIKKYSETIVEYSDFSKGKFVDNLGYFHERYQDKQFYKYLMYKRENLQLEQILKKDMSRLTPSEEIYFLVSVVYRYRNNIFHGNKGVSSWLNFSIQIDRCRHIMQELIDISTDKKAVNFISE